MFNTQPSILTAVKICMGIRTCMLPCNKKLYASDVEKKKTQTYVEVVKCMGISWISIIFVLCCLDGKKVVGMRCQTAYFTTYAKTDHLFHYI